MSRVVLLSRRQDEPTEGRLEPVPLIDALLELIPQTSSLAWLPRPLQHLCQSVEACGSVQRLIYTEISETGDVLEGALDSIPGGAEVWVDPGGHPVPEGSVAWGLMDGKVRRAPYRDAIQVEDEALLLVGDTPIRLAGIGLTIWLLAADAPTITSLVDSVVEVHGAHPEAETLVRDAVASMASAKVVAYSLPRSLIRPVTSESVAGLPLPPDSVDRERS